MSQVTGFKSTDLDNSGKVQPGTVNPIQYKRSAPDTIGWNQAYEVQAGTLAAGSTTNTLSITSIGTVARVGDTIVVDSRYLSIIAVDSNSVTIGQFLAGAPSAGTAYSVRRSVLLKTSSDGAAEVSVAGTPDVNLAEVGGVATSLGQKAESASIPVVLATEQDAVDTDVTFGNFVRVGVPWSDSGGETSGWKPWPYVGDGQSACTPTFVAKGKDTGSDATVPIAVENVTPGIGNWYQSTRSISYGVDNTNVARTIKTDTSGVVAIQDNGGSITIDAASLPLPTGAATALLQSTVMQTDGVTGENCLRVMGYDVDSSSFNPIPTGGFGTYIPVSVSTGMYGAEIGNADALTAVSDTVILNVLGGYCDGTITVSGTYSATMIFEGLSNSVWSELKCARIDGGVIPESNTGALVSISRTWRVNAAGFETIRVRCSAYVSGSVGVYIRLQSMAKSNQNTSLLPTGQSTMANSTTVAIASDQSAIPVVGAVAHDAADSGSPIKVGARARTSDITAVANDDRVDAIADRLGRRVVQPYTLDENVWHALNASDITNTTSTSIKAATASTRYCITAITVSNLHASVSTRVDILDGSTRIWTGPAAALGGGYSITFPTPLRLTSNTAINAQCGTSGAAVRVAIAGFSTAA